MKLIYISLCLFIGISVQAEILPPILLSDYDKADVIISVKSDVVQKSQETGLDPAAISFIKGTGQIPSPLPMQGEPPVQGADTFFLFFKNNNGKLEPVSRGWYMIGTSRATPESISNLKNNSFTQFLATVLSSETCSDCALQQSYLLAQSPDQSALNQCWNALSARKDLNPMLQLAALNIGVRAIGIDALKGVESPVGASDEAPIDLFEHHVKASLSSWIYKNANSKNHDQLLAFIQTQTGTLKSSGLNFISRYATPNDAPIIAKIFVSDNDPMVQYGCIHNLCTIFDENIMTIEDFQKNKEKIVADWKSILSSKGLLSSH